MEMNEVSERWASQKKQAQVTGEIFFLHLGASKNSGFFPQIILFNREISMKQTIHFGVPLFLETPT